METISVVITNYNHRDCLMDCLSSLYAQTYKDYEVIFVDNASTDGSLELIRQNFTGVKIIAVSKDSGEAKSLNIGIKYSKNNYIVLLNSDVWLEKNFLEELLNAIKTDSSIGICAPKILNFLQPYKIDAVGHGLYYDLFPFHIGQDEVDKGQYEKVMEVFGTCLAGGLFRKEVFDKVGLFDNDLFYIPGDDLTWRVKIAGYRCIYVPKAIMLHKRLACRITNPMALYFLERNRILIMTKYYPLNMAIASLYYTLKRLLISFISHAFLKKVEKRLSIRKTIFTIIRAWCAAIVKLPLFLKKRVAESKKDKKMSYIEVRAFLKRSWKSE